MEIKEILQEKENSLFNRKEIILNSESNSMPTKDETLKVLSSKFSVPEEAIAIQSIKGNFGTSSFTVSANLYKSSEDKTLGEPKPKTKKSS